MSDLLRDVETPSDAELISRVRGGDVAAYGELFSRHKDAANRLARQLVRGPDSDDLVAEAFAKVLVVLRGGGGPDVAFRAYLLTAVRRLHIDRVRLGQRLQTTDDMTPFDPGVPFKDTVVAGFESGAAAKAFASLPERWQLVLWHLEVEGQKPADIAPLLGMSANSVSALAYRAREGLRQAFLTMHLSDTSDTDCRWVNEHLGAYVRKGLAKRDAAKVEHHLGGCRRCTAMYLELRDVNDNLAGIIAPLLLGAAAAGYIASNGAGAAGVLTLVSRAKEVVVANTGSAAAAGVAAAVAAAAVVAVVVSQGNGGQSPNVVAEPPAGVTAPAPATTSSPPLSLASPTRPTSTRPGSPRPASPGPVSPSATGPTSAPTATLSPSASPSTGLSFAPLPPSFSLNPPLGPSSAPSSGPSTGPATSPSPGASGNPSAGPSGNPSAGPSGNPSSGPSANPTRPPASGAPGATPSAPPSTTPRPPGTPGRSVGAPVLSANGTVEVTVSNVRAGDTVDVSIDAQQTTFPITVGVSDCRTVRPDRVTCSPAAPGLGRVTAAAVPVTDYAVTLPLAFPASMVSDVVEVTAAVSGVDGAAGVSASTGRVTFRPERTPTFDFPAPVLSAPVHTLSGEEDRYDVTTTAVLPRRVTGLVYTVSAPGRFRAVDGCTVEPDGATLTCADLVDGATVDLSVAATSLTDGAEVEVGVSGVDRFDDPRRDLTSLALAPGADLDLDLGVSSANPDRSALVGLSGTLTGLRPGLRDVTYTVSPGPGAQGATFPAGHNPGCAVARGQSPDQSGATTALTCPAPPGGDVALTVTAPDRDRPTAVTVSVSPGAPFETVGTGPHAAVVVLPAFVPAHDFSMSGLTETRHTVAGDTDTYSLTSTVAALPDDVGALTFELTEGGTFTDAQDTGCQRLDDTHVRCAGLSAGRDVTFSVSSHSLVAHPTTVRLLRPAGYDDPDPGNDAGSVTGLRPGVDLHLASLGPDNESPANNDARHVVTTRLTGVRDGLGAVTFTLTGEATFTRVAGPRCDVTPETVTCRDPSDGPVIFTLTSATPGVATPVTIATAPAEPFVETLPSDNSRSASLAPRPTYDFGLGGLSTTAHTVRGDTDLVTLSSTVRAVPRGVDGLTFGLSGGTFAEQQEAGCERADATHVRCSDLVTSRRVGFRVESTSTSEQVLELTLALPPGFRDPSTGDHVASITLAPAVDLTLGPLAPADPVPAGGAYQVSSVLAGVRSGPVTFTVTGGARVTAAGCTQAGAAEVTCADLANGGTVRFTLTPDRPMTSTSVTIRARAADAFTELHAADNTATTSLAPDVTISTLTQRSDSPQYAGVRAQLSGVPAGVSTVRLHLSGDGVGLGPAQLHFTSGASGADGEGGVDCYTSNGTGAARPEGLDVTCTRVSSAPSGGFFVDTRVAHPHLTSRAVTFTVLAVGVDEGAHGGNNTRDVTIR